MGALVCNLGGLIRLSGGDCESWNVEESTSSYRQRWIFLQHLRLLLFLSLVGCLPSLLRRLKLSPVRLRLILWSACEVLTLCSCSAAILLVCPESLISSTSIALLARSCYLRGSINGLSGWISYHAAAARSLLADLSGRPPHTPMGCQRWIVWSFWLSLYCYFTIF